MPEITPCIHEVIKEKKRTKSKTASTSEVLSFQNQQEPKKQPTQRGSTFRHSSVAGTLRNPGPLGAGGIKKEQKRWAAGAPAGIAETRTPHPGEVHPRGPALIPHLLVQSGGLRPAPSPKDGPAGAPASALKIPVIPAKFLSSGSLLAAET